VDKKRFPRVTVKSRAQWRAWLEANHERQESIWLVTYKKHAGARYVPYDAVVEEALCFGWIDGVRSPVDELRTMLLLSPRRPRSVWSKLNKQRVERMVAAGLMREPGLRKIERAKRDGSWNALDASDSLAVPPELAEHAALLDKLTPSMRRNWLARLGEAKRPETKAKRLAEFVAFVRERGK
jgi:uncharacterized protein YdeI (YjbR/CyaY-like superfamily)